MVELLKKLKENDVEMSVRQDLHYMDGIIVKFSGRYYSTARVITWELIENLNVPFEKVLDMELDKHLKDTEEYMEGGY